MSPLNFQKQYDKYKDILIEEIIQEFGEEYRDVIIERINSHIIILQSNPLDDYTYLCKHDDKIKFTDRFIIKERYRKLKKIKEKARNELMDEFKWFIAAFFEIDKNILDQQDSNELVSLFGNENFDVSYIDSYNSDSMSLLNGEDTPQVVKKYILNDQRMLREKLAEYGITINDSFINQVDQFIEKRKLEKDGYYRRILSSNFSYNKELSQYLSTKNSEVLFYASFYENPCRSEFVMPDGQVIKFIFCSVVKYINQNIKSLDIRFIHELVHTVAQDGRNSIINEIVVQKSAINITRRLHEKGIFLFDDPNDYKIEGECGYEVLFPVVEPILLNYYDILKETLINGSFYSSDEVFGESWNKFLAELESLFYVLQNMDMRIKEHCTWQPDFSNINRYMEEMDAFYHRGGKHV